MLAIQKPKVRLPGIGVTVAFALAVIMGAGATISTGWHWNAADDSRAFTADTEVKSGVPTRSSNSAAIAIEPAGLAQSLQLDDLLVMMTLTPGLAGSNQMDLMYFSAAPAEPEAELAAVTVSYLDYGSVRLVVAPTESHPGHVSFNGLELPHAGRWRVEALIRGQGAEDTQAVFDVTVGQPR